MLVCKVVELEVRQDFLSAIAELLVTMARGMFFSDKCGHGYIREMRTDIFEALCIRWTRTWTRTRTLCRHVTIGTPMVIFAVLTVF